MKKCRKCGEFKDAEFFYVDRKMKLGLSSYCKECQRETTRGMRRKNIKTVEEHYREWATCHSYRHIAFVQKWR